MDTSNQVKEFKRYQNLSDQILEATLLQSVTRENKIKIEILHLLAEVERRRLYSKNFPSLFEYCISVLKYSRAAAQRRIDSMRAMKLIPEIEQKIVTGELNLSSIAQAQSFFRHEAKAGKKYSLEQKKEVLVKLENKSSRDCFKELVAISPQSVPQEKRRELTPEKTELKIVLDKGLIKRLDKIKNLLSHSNPNMTDRELIEVMAKLTLEKIDPEEKVRRKTLREAKQIGKAKSLVPTSELNRKNTPRNSQRSQILETLPEGPSLNDSSLKNQQPRKGVSPRYIPSTVKCEVYMRDKGQCTHSNCGSRKFLEYDHILPIAMGGKSTVENLRLLCRNHNQYAAIKKLGFKKMSRYLGYEVSLV